MNISDIDRDIIHQIENEPPPSHIDYSSDQSSPMHDPIWLLSSIFMALIFILVTLNRKK